MKVLRAKVPEGGFRASEELVLEDGCEGGGRRGEMELPEGVEGERVG